MSILTIDNGLEIRRIDKGGCADNARLEKRECDSFNQRVSSY